MKQLYISFILLSLSFSNSYAYQNKTTKAVDKIVVTKKTQPTKTPIKISNAIIANFVNKYPNLKTYRSDLNDLYLKRNYKSIWFGGKGLIEFANLLYAKTNELEQEGLQSKFAYKNKINSIFTEKTTKNLASVDTELLLSAMYLFYAQKVYKGIESDKIKEIGWLIPQKNLSYATLLSYLLVDPKALDKNDTAQFNQYYKLREVLKKYRKIEQNGGWNKIVRDTLVFELKPGDSSQTIGQIRQRLATTGDLHSDSKSNRYDQELIDGVINFKKRNGYNEDPVITFSQISRMNIPIENYIKTIMVNMERCRWIDPEMTKAAQYIIVNIPSYKLFFVRNGKTELESNVFVGGTMNETVIFSGNINYMVFSPYWNIPTSIVQSEIKTALEQNKNYLVENEMESIKGRVRQKPGPKNPLGKVKFIFPNSNDIYLHGSPSKSLFQSEYRAYSHGCINVNKSEELAYLILKDNTEWPVERIKSAMEGGKEITCMLKEKLPVHMGYFTAWVSDSGEISFFNDIYERDDRLAEILFSEDYN